MIDKHSELEKDLSENQIDSKLFAEKSKEYSNLNEIIKFAQKIILNFEKKKDLEKIIQIKIVMKKYKNLAKIEIRRINKKT